MNNIITKFLSNMPIPSRDVLRFFGKTLLESRISGQQLVESENIGFNGQKYRKLIFQELLEVFNFDAILETGTWIGSTTGYMAYTSNLPVYTCDLGNWLISIAKRRLKDIPNITFAHSDTRSFLKKMLEDFSNKKVFLYLDAHWYRDYPLEDELEIICNGFKNFVIMVDGFEVPGDNGYIYDNYGTGRVLSLEVFSHSFSKYELTPFFPKLASSEESGLKAGCVVLASKGDFSDKLSSIKSLCTKEL